MADASSYYAIRNFAIAANTWTPIVAGINCNAFSVQCDTAMKIRTDADDPVTEQSIPAGVQQITIVSWSWISPRWMKGSVLAYLQSVSGTPNVTAVFVY